MAAPKVWVSAARLRTLPLSLSGIIVGNALALGQVGFRFSLFGLALLTAVALQVLSNFANDYGDGVRGTDNEDRIGPKRMVQLQLLSPKALMRGIIVMALFAIASALTLIYFAFGSLWVPEALCFILLALGAAIAAYTYTAGAYPYGYYGLGDVFVFLFFGLVAVVGSFYVQLQLFTPSVGFFAIAIGFLSAAVLNLNNMRDYSSDKAAKKNTLVVFLGPQRAKVYHFALILSALIAVIFGILPLGMQPLHLCLAPVFLGLLWHLNVIRKVQQPQGYDPQLKVVALLTFGLSVVFLIIQGML